MPVVDPVSCIVKIATNTEFYEKTKRYAVNILRKAEAEHILAGKDPMGLAAALYLASIKTENNITQLTLSEASGISEVTIRNRCKNLKTIMD
jgi:transcription initiation factor TFIIB